MLYNSNLLIYFDDWIRYQWPEAKQEDCDFRVNAKEYNILQ